MITLIKPEGSSIIGRPDGGLVPVDLDYGRPYAKCPALPGAISVPANSKIITGSGGADFTRHKPGDYLNLSPTIAPSKIESIASATSLTVRDPIQMAISNGVYKMAEQYRIGLTLETTMEESIGYAEFKAQQKGSQAYKKLVNSYMLTVKAKLVEPVLETLQKILH
ncbi:hypothetical protein [Leptospira stimsonii]|uniref:hypothetical protein n=1 Tax=Leptospira stimsonii TaxID=2202203 RepID=UPI001FEDC9D0|nr:hypothetical protein [Leptospira stimsonii]